MIPLSRTENLSVEEIGNEVILFDELNDISHSLSPFAARVWHHANGRNSVKEIAALLEKEFSLKKGEAVDARGVVRLALEELEGKGLMEAAVAAPVPVEMTRRSLLKGGGTLLGRAALVSLLFPMINSVDAHNEKGKGKGHEKGKGKGHEKGKGKGHDHDYVSPTPPLPPTPVPVATPTPVPIIAPTPPTGPTPTPVPWTPPTPDFPAPTPGWNPPTPF